VLKKLALILPHKPVLKKTGLFFHFNKGSQMDIATTSFREGAAQLLQELSLLWEAKVPKRKRKGLRPVSVEVSGSLVFLRLERRRPGRTKLIPKAVLTSAIDLHSESIREFFFEEKRAAYVQVCAAR
jgi:hypothetical protein